MLFNAYREHVYHSQREGLSVGQSSSSVSEKSGQPVVEIVAKSHDRSGQPVVERGQEVNTEHAQNRTLLDKQKEEILAECQAEIKNHEFQADYDRRSIRKIGEIIESQQEELHCAQAEELQRRDQQLLHERLLQPNSELREAHHKSLNEMEELKKFQSSTFDTITRRKLIEDQDTILELTGEIHELQNEINCLNDSRDLKDAESVRSGQSHVTSQLAFFPLFQNRGGMLSRSFGMPSRREGPPSIWGHTWYILKRFCRSRCVIFSTLSAVLICRNQFTHHKRERVRTKHQIKIRDASPDRQPEIHSSLARETLQRIMGQTNDDCRFQIFISTNFLHQKRCLLVGR